MCPWKLELQCPFARILEQIPDKSRANQDQRLEPLQLAPEQKCLRKRRIAQSYILDSGWWSSCILLVLCTLLNEVFVRCAVQKTNGKSWSFNCHTSANIGKVMCSLNRAFWNTDANAYRIEIHFSTYLPSLGSTISGGSFWSKIWIITVRFPTAGHGFCLRCILDIDVNSKGSHFEDHS